MLVEARLRNPLARVILRVTLIAEYIPGQQRL